MTVDSCPKCGGVTFSQPADLHIRDRVKCDGCGEEYARRDLWLLRQQKGEQ